MDDYDVLSVSERRKMFDEVDAAQSYLRRLSVSLYLPGILGIMAVGADPLARYAFGLDGVWMLGFSIFGIPYAIWATAHWFQAKATNEILFLVRQPLLRRTKPDSVE